VAIQQRVTSNLLVTFATDITSTQYRKDFQLKPACSRVDVLIAALAGQRIL
jgi:hypothetical protein